MILTYFVRPVGHDVVKIGSAVDPFTRLQQLQSSSWTELYVAGLTLLAERALHRQFEQLRLRGEWFSEADMIMEAAFGIDKGESKPYGYHTPLLCETITKLNSGALNYMFANLAKAMRS